MPDAMPIADMEAALNPGVEYFEAVALKGPGVKETLQAISAKVLTKLRKQMEEGEPQSALEDAARKRMAAEQQQADERSKAIDAIDDSIPLPSAGALASQGVEVPKDYPAPGQAPKEPEEKKKKKQKAAAALNIVQKCDVHWRGMRIGSASIRISSQA